MIVVFFNAFYCHLIAGGKALLLSSFTVVAVLFLPCSPPPPSPPLLTDHDLGRQCVAPAAIDLACKDLTTFVVFNRAELLQPRPLSPHKEFFDFMFLGLVAHLLGKDLFYGLNI
jgi:hypothetical protein